MWRDTRICELLGIQHPIIQAPMLGSSTIDLAAAVSAAGGLGSVAAGSLDAARVRALAADFQAVSDAPYLMNFFVLDPVAAATPEQIAVLSDRLQPMYDELGLGEVPAVPPGPTPGFSSELLDLMLEIRPPVISFHFGLPESHAIAALKDAGIVLLASATNTDEARQLEAAGMDAIIAQGWEAGGHRGSRVPGGPSDGVGLVALVPQVVDAVQVPVIAAGGIADGRGITAALALGASGVQIGTLFLGCPEAATSARHRELIRNASDSDTVFSDALSGRAARRHKSEFGSLLADLAGQLPPFPTMYGLSAPVQKASLDQRPEPVSPFLFGQAAGLGRERPAGDVVAELVAETLAVMEKLATP